MDMVFCGLNCWWVGLVRSANGGIFAAGFEGFLELRKVTNKSVNASLS
jgi:hypothetical protein